MKGDTILCLKNISNISVGGGKIPSEIKSQSKSHKNLIHDHAEKIRTFAFCIIFALLWGTSPVGAAVNDNLQTVAQALLGPVDAQVTGSYESSSTNAKLNSLQKQVTTLQNYVNELRTALGK